MKDWQAQSEALFPEHRAVIACSGPSLRGFDVYGEGCPVVAISTAVRWEGVWDHRDIVPTAWCNVDPPNHNHGEHHPQLLRDERCVHVSPEDTAKRDRTIESKAARMIIVPYNRRVSHDTGRKPFHEPPLLRSVHKTVTFAVQWLWFAGVREVIFAGCDLNTGHRWEEKYAYRVRDNRQLSAQPRALKSAGDALVGWAGIAMKAGYRWITASPGPLTSCCEMHPLLDCEPMPPRQPAKRGGHTDHEQPRSNPGRDGKEGRRVSSVQPKRAR